MLHLCSDREVTTAARLGEEHEHAIEAKVSDQTASTQPMTEALIRDLLNKQKADFATCNQSLRVEDRPAEPVDSHAEGNLCAFRRNPCRMAESERRVWEITTGSPPTIH